MTFLDTELAEGIQRHGLIGLLRGALGRPRRGDAEPLPNLLCALLVWPLLKAASLHCFCTELCQFLTGKVSVLYDFEGREDIHWRWVAGARFRGWPRGKTLGFQGNSPGRPAKKVKPRSQYRKFG